MSITEAKAAAERLKRHIEEYFECDRSPLEKNALTVARALLSLTSGTDEERARDLVEIARGCVSAPMWSALKDELTAALAAVRAEERERAAGIARKWLGSPALKACDDGSITTINIVSIVRSEAKSIATAIMENGQ